MAFIDVFADDPSDIRSLQLNFKGLDGYSHMYLTGAVELSFDLLGYFVKGSRFPLNDYANCHKSMLESLSSLIVLLSDEYEILYDYDYVLNERCSLEFDSLETLLYATTILQLVPRGWGFIDRAVENGIIDSQYIKKIYFDHGMDSTLEEFEKFRDTLMHLQRKQFRESHDCYCKCKRCTEGTGDSQNELVYYSKDHNFVKGMSKGELDKISFGLNETYKVILEDHYWIQYHKFYEELYYSTLVNARILQANGLRTLAMPPVIGKKSLVSALRTKVGGLSSSRLKFVSGFLIGGFTFAALVNAKSRAPLFN